MRILMIDDDKGLCQMTHAILTKNGYTVDVFHDAVSGMNAARQNKPNLILMDIMLPDLSGPEIVNSLKEDPQFKDVPVIFLTALVTGNEESVEGQGIMVAGVRYQVLGKPYEIHRLLHLIRTQIK